MQYKLSHCISNKYNLWLNIAFYVLACNVQLQLVFLKILSALLRFTFQECLRKNIRTFTVSLALTCTQNKFKHIFIEAKQIVLKIRLIRLIAANGDCKKLVLYTGCACLCDRLLCCYSCSLGSKRGKNGTITCSLSASELCTPDLWPGLKSSWCCGALPFLK